MTEPAASVRFQVLGPLVVRTAERTLAPGSAARRALLGLLLLADGQPLPTDRLLRGVWGDEPPNSGRAAVHVAVSRLRSWLERSVGDMVAVGHRAGGYRLQVPAVSVDAARFRVLVAAAARGGSPQARVRHLHDALDLWHGPAVADGTPWVGDDALVRRVERLQVDAACALADAALAARRPGFALPYLEATVEAHPLDERAQAALAVALAADGRQAEALGVVERARARLVDELGLDPGPQLRDAHLRILRQQVGHSTPDGQGLRDERGGGGRPFPVQIPPDTAEFTGREEELAELQARLRGAAAGPGPTMAPVAIDGKPGVGKSALAVHLAHRLAPNFPDGLLYVDLRGRGARRLPPSQALGRLLRALGSADGQVPSDLGTATAGYRGLLAGRQVLVVLDNADGTAQVQPLLPATAGCAVLLTSRAQLADLDGVAPLTLDLPPQPDAVALLAKLAGNQRVAVEPQAAARIVAHCGLLPLAVRIAGSRLRSHPLWPLAELAARLADEHRRLDELAVGHLDVRSSFQLSYRALPAPQARTFRLLGLLDGEAVTAEAAAALTGRPDGSGRPGIPGRCPAARHPISRLLPPARAPAPVRPRACPRRGGRRRPASGSGPGPGVAPVESVATPATCQLDHDPP